MDQHETAPVARDRIGHAPPLEVDVADAGRGGSFEMAIAFAGSDRDRLL